MRTPVAAGALALLALYALPSAGVVPPPLQPLEIGDYWEYQAPTGEHQIQTITGTLMVLGRTVYAKHYAEGLDAGLDNWWLTGPAGEVLLAGFDRHDGFTLGYEPPITVCGSTLLGDTWSTHVVAYNMSDMSVYDEFDITFAALENVVLNLPAGMFPSTGVGPVAPAVQRAIRSAGAFALDGRRLSASPVTAGSGATDWYCVGVGDVQYVTSALYQLTAWGSPTPTLAGTWGALKRLYR